MILKWGGLMVSVVNQSIVAERSDTPRQNLREEKGAFVKQKHKQFKRPSNPTFRENSINHKEFELMCDSSDINPM
jgi:hypothetical protein